jgi:hypothetical protein
MRRAITYLQSLHRLSSATITMDTLYMVAGVIPKVKLIVFQLTMDAGRNRRNVEHLQISFFPPSPNGRKQNSEQWL